jgi:hypothetical protein
MLPGKKTQYADPAEFIGEDDGVARQMSGAPRRSGSLPLFAVVWLGPR